MKNEDLASKKINLFLIFCPIWPQVFVEFFVFFLRLTSTANFNRNKNREKYIHEKTDYFNLFCFSYSPFG